MASAYKWLRGSNEHHRAFFFFFSSPSLWKGGAPLLREGAGPSPVPLPPVEPSKPNSANQDGHRTHFGACGMGFDKDGVCGHVGQAPRGAPCALQQPQASTSQQPLGCSWAPPSSFLTRGIPQLPPTTPKSPFLGALRPGKAPRVQLVPTSGNPPVGHCGTVQRRPQSPAHPARLLFFFPPFFPKKNHQRCPSGGM